LTIAKHISTPQKILGLMTGSSADSLDICLVHFSGSGEFPAYELIYSGEVAYPQRFNLAFRDPLQLSDEQINTLHIDLGKWFADEILKLDLEFDAIASHGQTIKHEPPHFSLQIGDPHSMANLFSVPVIYDFRTADIELGGQGAPLIPIVDRYLFQKGEADILALNIGGIANLTVLPSKINQQPILAWDTGPGNTLIDKAVRAYSHGNLTFDPEGSLAAQGALNQTILDFLLSHKFYQMPPPRSAGQEQFGNDYFNSILKQFYPANDQEFKDLILTLTVLTAKSITVNVLNLSENYNPGVMFVSGGGFKNSTLMRYIQKELININVKGVELKGIDGDNKEAFGFAYLGYRTLMGLPGNIPSVTGASRSTILGKICYPI